MKLYDLSTISSARKKTREGFLLVPAYLGRSGIQVYDAYTDFLPGELPASIERKPGNLVRLLRPEKEVFRDETLASCANLPVTDGHPVEGYVDAGNVKQLQVGFSRDSVEREGDKIKAQLKIQDKGTIEKIESQGIDQISLGYSTDIVWTSGIDEVYGEYDGVQTNIKSNHIAIVKKGRAGPDIRLSDHKPITGERKMATRKVDGITVEVTDQAGEVIDKLTKDLGDAYTEIETVEKKLADATKEVDRLKGELDVERSKSVDHTALDAMIEERIALVDAARKLNPKIEATGKTASEIRVLAISAVNDSFDLVNRSDEYIEAVFDAMVKTHKPRESAAISGDLKGLADGVKDEVSEARARMVAARNAGRK